MRLFRLDFAAGIDELEEDADCSVRALPLQSPEQKLALVERLFSLTRDKLMKIPAFAWAYTKFQEAKVWLEAIEAWQAIRAISKAARQYLTEMKKSAAVAFRHS